MTNFDRYKYLKGLIKFEYKDISLQQIIAFDLIVSTYFGSGLKIKHLVFFFLRYKLPSNINSFKGTLYTIGDYSARKDYYEIWDYVGDIIKPDLKIDFHNINKVLSFRLINIFRSLNALRIIYKEVSIKEFIYLWAKLTFYINIIDNIFNKNLNYSSYIGFSTVHPLEAIFTLYFKLRGVPTYSLQHGLYYIFKNPIPIDSLAYENICSDYHFCWGQYTKDEFISYGINPDRLFVAGYPRKIDRGFPRQVCSLNKCVVLLSRKMFNSSNLKVLEILKEVTSKINFDVYLKLHPTLNHEEYVNLANHFNFHIVDHDVTISELFKSEKYDFSISVNTGAYYESYIYYTPCFRFITDSFDLSIDVDDDIFCNDSELLIQLKKLVLTDSITYWMKVNESLKYIMGIGIKRYVV